MGHNHNYSNHFKNNHQAFVGNKVIADVRDDLSPDDENSEVETVEQIETVAEETVNVVQYKKGVVSGCKKLRVREKASVNSELLLIIDEGTELQVDLSNDNQSAEFYKVVVPSGIEGYCMKEFIKLV